MKAKETAEAEKKAETERQNLHNLSGLEASRDLKKEFEVNHLTMVNRKKKMKVDIKNSPTQSKKSGGILKSRSSRRGSYNADFSD